MSNDTTPVHVNSDTDEDTTELTVRITPKQKLIAKIAGAATAVAGLLAIGYKLGSSDFDDDSVGDLEVVEVDFDEVDTDD